MPHFYGLYDDFIIKQNQIFDIKKALYQFSSSSDKVLMHHFIINILLLCDHILCVHKMHFHAIYLMHAKQYI